MFILLSYSLFIYLHYRLYTYTCNTHIHELQALDLAKRLRNPVAIAGAIKVANHFGRASMAQKLEDMMQQRVAEATDAAAAETAVDYGAVDECDSTEVEYQYTATSGRGSGRSGSDSRSASAHTTVSAPVTQSHPLLMSDKQYEAYRPSTTATSTSTKRKHDSPSTDIEDDEVYASRYRDDVPTGASATSAIQSLRGSGTNPFNQFAVNKKSKGVTFSASTENSMEQEEVAGGSDWEQPVLTTGAVSVKAAAVNTAIPTNPFEKKLVMSSSPGGTVQSGGSRASSTRGALSGMSSMMSPSPKKTMFVSTYLPTYLPPSFTYLPT